MKQEFNWNKGAQFVAVLGCALALKAFYSTASADQLRWILAPTTVLVELVNGVSFEFESHAGYLSRERGFLIASSCAGVNFLITAFLLLALGKLLRAPGKNIAWTFIPAAAAIAYLVTLVANTTRIAIALQLRELPNGVYGLNPVQLHRLEGIVIYFGFLLLLFVLSEHLSAAKQAVGLRQLWLPLLVYYAFMLGLPLANNFHHLKADFREHALTVLLIPLLLVLPLALYRVFWQQRLSQRTEMSR
jgi:exosortase K